MRRASCKSCLISFPVCYGCGCVHLKHFQLISPMLAQIDITTVYPGFVLTEIHDVAVVPKGKQLERQAG